MRVTVYYIRHGESQANVVQHQQSCGTVKHLLMKDPPLTEKGIKTCEENSSSAPQVDIVLSSELLRAIQTALHTYPTRFVQVVPYLNELGTGLDNVPLSPGEQNEALGSCSTRVIRLNRQSEGSVIEYIKRHVVPTFARDHLRVALFTHSRLMRKHLNMTLDELDNNCVECRDYVM